MEKGGFIFRFFIRCTFHVLIKFCRRFIHGHDPIMVVNVLKPVDSRRCHIINGFLIGIEGLGVESVDNIILCIDSIFIKIDIAIFFFKITGSMKSYYQLS